MDDLVKSIKRTYDSLGRLERILSYANNNGSGTVRNDVKIDYNTVGTVSKSWQSHEGAVTGGTPAVSYGYDTDQTGNIFIDGMLLDRVYYPLITAGSQQAQIVYYYGSANSLNDRLHRPVYHKQWSGTLTSTSDTTLGSNYWYNGTNRLVKIETEHMSSTVTATQNWFSSTGNYSSLDRFGRTLQTKWVKSSTVKDQFDYTYDYAGNRLTRDIPSSLYATNNQDQVYSYDGLHRLKNFDAGTLSGASISGTPTREQDWTLDQLGNWPNFVVKSGGTTVLDQQRTHNSVNEIDTDNNHGNSPGASIAATTGSNWVDPKYDAAGNMIWYPYPSSPSNAQEATYDAWNRLASVYNATTSDELRFHEYDGLNRLIVSYSGITGLTSHYYYNEQWQVLLEAEGTSTITPTAIYSYHPYYVDAIAHRMRATDEHVYLQDANFNVTALLEPDGDVAERYSYSPYGEVTFLDANFANPTTTSAIGNEILYTGRWRDPSTGLQLNRNRWYYALLGRWGNRDPIGYWGGINLYEYVGSSPVRYTDPSGEIHPIIIIIPILPFLPGCSRPTPNPPAPPPVSTCPDTNHCDCDLPGNTDQCCRNDPNDKHRVPNPNTGPQTTAGCTTCNSGGSSAKISECHDCCDDIGQSNIRCQTACGAANAAGGGGGGGF